MAKVYGKMENSRTMTALEDIDRYVMENWETLDDETTDDKTENAEYLSPIKMRDNIM